MSHKVRVPASYVGKSHTRDTGSWHLGGVSAYTRNYHCVLAISRRRQLRGGPLPLTDVLTPLTYPTSSLSHVCEPYGAASVALVWFYCVLSLALTMNVNNPVFTATCSVQQLKWAKVRDIIISKVNVPMTGHLRKLYQ